MKEAVESVWKYLTKIRQPCLSGDGHPAIWFKSHALIEPNPDRNFGRYEEDRAPIYEHHASMHSPRLPSVIKVGEVGPTRYDWPTEILIDVNRIESSNLFGVILSSLDFSGPDCEPSICGTTWTVSRKNIERRPRCPKCGEFGTGFGTIGNEKRFYHEQNRSCYLGVSQPRLKRNPLVKCAKCGEMGREHHGKDGHIRVRHSDRICYIADQV